MIDEQIRDGDTVVVEARETARNGETIIALVDDVPSPPGGRTRAERE